MSGSYKGRCQSQLKARRESRWIYRADLSATRKHGQIIAGVTRSGSRLRAPMQHPGGHKHWPLGSLAQASLSLFLSGCVLSSCQCCHHSPTLPHSTPFPFPSAAQFARAHIRHSPISSSSYHRLPASHSFPVLPHDSALRNPRALSPVCDSPP